MITFRRIEKTLEFLDAEYNKSLRYKDQEIPVLYSKMAILEYCGWLEAAFDEVARNCVRRNLRTCADRKMLEDEIKKTHGFRYNENFRPLLAYGLGLIKLKRVEKKLNASGELDQLKSILGNMNKSRREAAHTFTSGRTPRFDAPSATISNYKRTRPILKKLWCFVRQD